MTVVKISTRFQVVIPQRIREALGLRSGQMVQAFQYRDRVEFVPVKDMKATRGFLRGIDTSVGRDRDQM